MRIIDKCDCPNCGKSIECQMIRRPTIRVKEEKIGKAKTTRFIKVSGIYKWVCSPTSSSTKKVKNE